MPTGDPAAAREHFEKTLSLLPVDTEIDGPTGRRLEARAKMSLATLAH